MEKSSILRLKFYFFTFLWECFIILLARKIFDTFYFVKGYNINYDIESKLLVFLSMFLALMPAFFMPLENKAPSSAFFIILYYFHIIPSIILFPVILSDYSEYIILIFLIFFMLIFTLYLISYQFLPKKIDITNIIISKKRGSFLYMGRIIIIIVICIGYLTLVKTCGLNFSVPSIFSVYTQRKLFKEELINLPKITLYIVTNFAYVLSPFLIMKGVTSDKVFKKILFILIAFATTFYLFSLVAYKSSLFAIAISFIIYLLLRKSYTYVYTLSKYIIILSITLGVFYFLIHNSILDTLILHWLRRVTIVQGLNVAYHIDYIMSNDLILTHIPFYKYSSPIISETYYGTSGNAPAGILGSMFEIYGVIGIFITLILLTFFLISIDTLAKYFKEEIIVSLSVSIFYIITGTSITTIFFTYGFILLLMLFYFKFYNKNWRKYDYLQFNINSLKV